MAKIKLPGLIEDARINTAIANDPDTWEATEEEMKSARRGRPFMKDEDRKVRTTMRLDRTVIEHFKAGGQGWQTRVNAVLAQHVASAGGKQQEAISGVRTAGYVVTQDAKKPIGLSGKQRESKKPIGLSGKQKSA